MQFRRLLRFRLRTLLILFAVLSVWLTLHIRSTRMQKEAVQAIQDYGGWVRYDFQFPSGHFSHKDFDSKAKSWVPKWLLARLGFDFFHSVVQVNLNYSEDSGKREENDNSSDEALQHLVKLPNLRVLLLSNSQATDRSMRYLANLKRLERLYMWDVTHVSDEGVAQLGKLSNLKYVHIDNSRISDSSLRIFGSLKKLEGLSLQGNHFTDAGLYHLSDLTELKSLWMNMGSTSCTDQGLSYLRRLTNLEELTVQGTGITDEGLKYFEPLKNLKYLAVSSDAVTTKAFTALQATLKSARCQLYRPMPDNKNPVSFVVERGVIVTGTDGSDVDENSVDLPQLHCISQHHFPPKDPSKPLDGVYWTPDGKKIDDARTLEIIRNVQGDPRSKSCLFFFFTHPDFLRTYARVTITDADGKIVDPKMSRRTSLLTGRPGDSPRAIALRVFIPEYISLPGHGTVRLHYTIGEWSQVSTFGLDRSLLPPYVDKGMQVLAIGQDVKKRAFVTIWIDADRKQQFQYRSRAVLRDSTALESSSRSESYEPVDVTTFGYGVPLEDIQSFGVYRRPVQVMEIDNVSFLPGSVTTPTYRKINQ